MRSRSTCDVSSALAGAGFGLVQSQMRSRSTCDVACANGISLRVNQFQSQMRSRSTCDDEPLSATWARGMFQSQMRSRSTCDENAPAATLKGVIVSISDEKPLHMRRLFSSFIILTTVAL